MENIQQSQLTLHNSWGLTATSMEIISGRQNLRANVNFLLAIGAVQTSNSR